MKNNKAFKMIAINISIAVISCCFLIGLISNGPYGMSSWTIWAASTAFIIISVFTNTYAATLGLLSVFTKEKPGQEDQNK